jgi:hypothetical protein
MTKWRRKYTAASENSIGEMTAKYIWQQRNGMAKMASIVARNQRKRQRLANGNGNNSQRSQQTSYGVSARRNENGGRK